MPTNVTRLARAVRSYTKKDGIHQIIYYQSGVGTGSTLNKLIGGESNSPFLFEQERYHIYREDILQLMFREGGKFVLHISCLSCPYVIFFTE